MAQDIPRNKYTRVPSERRPMVKGKASYVAPEDVVMLKPAAKITKQPMRSKLSSTDRRDLLATSRERTHSKAKTSGSRSAPWKENANCGTKQREVQMSTSSGGPDNHPGFPTQSVPGSLKHISGAEDRPTKQVTPSASSKSSPHLKTWNDGCERMMQRAVQMSTSSGGPDNHPGFPTQSVPGSLKHISGAENRPTKQDTPSASSKSSPHLKTWNDGCERMMQRAVQMSTSSGGPDNHPGFPTQSVPGSLKHISGAEDRPTKQVTPSASSKSSPHLKTWNDGCEIMMQRAVQMSTSSGGPDNHPGFPTQSVPESLKHISGAEDRPTKQVTPSASSKSSPHLKTWNDGFERVGTSLNREEGTQLMYANAVEDRLGKQVIPSGDRKSSPHPAMPRISINTGFYSSSKSGKQNDCYERVDLPSSDKEGPRKKLMCNDGPLNIISTTKEVKASSSKIERPASSSTSSVPTKPVPISDSVNTISATKEVKASSRIEHPVSSSTSSVPIKPVPKSDSVKTISISKEVKASSSRIKRPVSSSTSSVPIKPVPISDSVYSNLAVACPSNHESHKRKSSKALYDSLKYPRNGPALQTIWKGAFEVINLSQGLGFCERLIAHLSAKVSAKAYKVSKQITGVLKFKSVSRSELWPELFQIRSPDWNDIALYFYPDKSDSSYRKKYADLLRYMVKNDILLRSRIGHVELLCFASNTLALDCQELSGNYFMWGVFRRLKCNTTTRDMVRVSSR